MRETVTLNTQEQKRVMVLNRIVAGQLSAAEAGVLLEKSPRQVQRILAAYRKEGIAAVAHGNRGRKPVHTIRADVRNQVIALATTTYAGCNQQHLRDLLEEREGIMLSRSSVHRVLQQAGLLPEPQRRKPQHRRRRKRYAQEGMLVQIDGSRHAWLEERGPWLSPIAAIGDATGKLAAAVFREEEDAAGYFLLVPRLIHRHGRPLALYHDRHSIFAHTRKATETDTLAEQLAGKRDPTQFGRLLEELEVTSIAARSPQAKGRVERLFGTLQERLVVELRLAGGCTIEQANRVLASYLPRFNERFAVPPAQEGSAYRPVQDTSSVEQVFCFKYPRTVAADNTISFAKQRLQLLPDAQRCSYTKARVQVHEHLDGHLSVHYAGRCLATTPAPLEAPKLRARSGSRGTKEEGQMAATHGHPTNPAQEPSASKTQQSASTSTVPGPTHPWRKRLLPPRSFPAQAEVT
jgi:transposase